MRLKHFLAVSGVFLAGTLPVHAQQVQVAKFQGDRPAAISYTFDDGLRDHYTIVFPMLEELDLKATFFIVGKPVAETKEEAEAKKPGAFGGISWPELKEIADKGHEIASHSWTHGNMPMMDDARLQDEIDLNIAKIQEKLGITPLTFCYPGNSHNEHVREVVLTRHFAARNTQFEIGQATITAADANAITDGLIAQGRWGVAMIHAISNGYHALASPDVLREHLVYVKGQNSKVWVDTFANIARYVAERNTAQITVQDWQPGRARFTVTCPPSKPAYDVPLTLILKTGGVKEASANRGTDKLPLVIRGDVALITALPGEAPIDVTWR